MRKMRKDNKISPVALTIAGSDSGGGAGIQADLKTFAHFGVFGTSAITAITAQNPCEVRRIDPLPPASVKAQAEAVFAKFAVKAVKTGMLFNAQIISATIEILRKNPSVIYVADPVMIATSGAVLLRPDAIEKLKSGLLPLADWVTPNIPEAEILSGMKITGVSDMRKAALICSESGSTVFFHSVSSASHCALAFSSNFACLAANISEKFLASASDSARTRAMFAACSAACFAVRAW